MRELEEWFNNVFLPDCANEIGKSIDDYKVTKCGRTEIDVVRLVHDMALHSE